MVTKGEPRVAVATVVLPSDRRDVVLGDMVLLNRLLLLLSLSTMSVIAVFAFWAAARRGRDAIGGQKDVGIGGKAIGMDGQRLRILCRPKPKGKKT